MKSNEFKYRFATIDDLPDILRMLSDDNPGAKREYFSEVLSDEYVRAFDRLIMEEDIAHNAEEKREDEDLSGS